MNWSDVAEVKELSEPEFIHHYLNTADISTVGFPTTTLRVYSVSLKILW